MAELECENCKIEDSLIVAIKAMTRSNIISLLLHKQHMLSQAHFIETSTLMLLKNKRIKQKKTDFEMTIFTASRTF